MCLLNWWQNCEFIDNDQRRSCKEEEDSINRVMNSSACTEWRNKRLRLCPCIPILTQTSRDPFPLTEFRFVPMSESRTSTHNFIQLSMTKEQFNAVLDQTQMFFFGSSHFGENYQRQSCIEYHLHKKSGPHTLYMFRGQILRKHTGNTGLVPLCSLLTRCPREVCGERAGECLSVTSQLMVEFRIGRIYIRDELSVWDESHVWDG